MLESSKRQIPYNEQYHLAMMTRQQYLLRSLRLGHEGSNKNAPTCHANDRPPVHHCMTSSARPSTDGGIVSPSALAVLRLITNSYFVGCSTGRSPGFVPLRILST